MAKAKPKKAAAPKKTPAKKPAEKKSASKPAAAPAAPKAEKTEAKAPAPAAPAKPTIAEELGKATGVNMVNPGETREQFLDRLINAVNVLTDDQFNKLSVGAREWFNGACDAHQAGKLKDLEVEGDPFKRPESAATEVAEEQEEEAPAEQAAEEQTQAEAASETASEAPAPAKAAKKTREPKEDNGARKNNSLTQRIRIEICKNPTLKDDELMQLLAPHVPSGEKLSESYVEAVALRTRQVLEVKAAVDAGKLS